MICSNPNCKSVIPDDSKFCPDCGTPIKNEEELRRKAKEIVTMYPKGYDYLVKYQSLPHFVYNLKVENCEKIIAKKQDIIKKHNEISQEEKRIKDAKETKELEDKRREVSQIQGTYSKGYYYYAQLNVIPYYGCLSSADCDRVIANKYKIIQMHNEIVAEEKRLMALEHQRQQEAERQKQLIEEEGKKQEEERVQREHISWRICIIAFGIMGLGVIIGFLGLHTTWVIVGLVLMFGCSIPMMVIAAIIGNSK